MTGSGWSRIPLGDFVTLQRGHDLPEQQAEAAELDAAIAANLQELGYDR